MVGSRIEAGAKRGTQWISRITRLIRTKLMRRVFAMAGTKNAGFASQYCDLLAQLHELLAQAGKEAAEAGHLGEGLRRPRPGGLTRGGLPGAGSPRGS